MKNLFLLSLLILFGCSSTQIETPTTNGPWTHLNFNDTPKMFQFAIVTDRTGGHRPGVFEKALGQVNLLQPEFVICVGDLIEGYIEDEEGLNTQWDEFDGFLDQLDMPYFYVAGNHDISNEKMAELYRARYGQPYYHFVYKNCLFLVVCTEDPPQANISEEQVTYMKRVLADNPSARWTFVFMHQPLFRTEPDEKHGETTNTRHENWERIETALKDRPHTVFSGHWHSYCKYERNGQSYFRLATTGGGSPLRGKDVGQFDHFTWVTLKEDGPQIANIALDAVFGDDVLTEESLQFTASVQDGGIACPPIFVDEPLFSNGTTRLILKNQTGQPLTFDITVTPDSALHIEQNRFSETLQPEQKRVIAIPVSTKSPVDPAQLAPTKLEYTVQQTRNGKTLKITDKAFTGIVRKHDCPPADKITVDGILDDWPDLPFDIREPAAVLKDADSYTGGEDCHFRFGTAYDNNFLYIAIDVFDDKLVQIENSAVWSQDSIEIRLLALPEPERSLFRGGSEWKDVLPIAALPINQNGEIGVWGKKNLPEGTQIASKMTDTGYTIEVAVPASYLTEKQGESWREFRLSLAVNDSDKSGTVAQLWWVPDLREQNTYAGSGTFKKSQ